MICYLSMKFDSSRIGFIFFLIIWVWGNELCSVFKWEEGSLLVVYLVVFSDSFGEEEKRLDIKVKLVGVIDEFVMVGKEKKEKERLDFFYV